MYPILYLLMMTLIFQFQQTHGKIFLVKTKEDHHTSPRYEDYQDSCVDRNKEPCDGFLFGCQTSGSVARLCRKSCGFCTASPQDNTPQEETTESPQDNTPQEGTNEKCGSNIASFIRGNTYDERFPMNNMFCDTTKETHPIKNYWLTKYYHKGESFIADLGSSIPIIGVTLRNTNNAGYGDMSTKKFRVYVGIDSDSGPWTEVLTQDLEDSRKQDPPPKQQFQWENPVNARFIQFEILEYWGLGSGLSYFDVIPAPSG